MGLRLRKHRRRSQFKPRGVLVRYRIWLGSRQTVRSSYAAGRWFVVNTPHDHTCRLTIIQAEAALRLGLIQALESEKIAWADI